MFDIFKKIHLNLSLSERQFFSEVKSRIALTTNRLLLCGLMRVGILCTNTYFITNYYENDQIMLNIVALSTPGDTSGPMTLPWLQTSPIRELKSFVEK